MAVAAVARTCRRRAVVVVVVGIRAAAEVIREVSAAGIQGAVVVDRWEAPRPLGAHQAAERLAAAGRAEARLASSARAVAWVASHIRRRSVKAVLVGAACGQAWVNGQAWANGRAKASVLARVSAPGAEAELAADPAKAFGRVAARACDRGARVCVPAAARVCVPEKACDRAAAALAMACAPAVVWG